MPTGYTAAVADGEISELEPFVWQLARGMGALVTMRDEPWDAPIPESFEPSTKYYDEALATARSERDRLYGMSGKDAQAAADAEYAEWNRQRDAASEDHRARRNRYNAMLAQVVQWQGAPEGIKEFALEQLTTGRDFDCREPFQFYRDPPLRDGSEWRRAKLEKCARDIANLEAERAKEVARTEGRNAWLTQLRKSLAEHKAKGGQD